MADLCDVYTLGTNDIVFNADTGDTWLIQDLQGLDGAPIRREIEDNPQAPGKLLYPAFLDARIITFEGTLLIRSVEPEDIDGYAAAQQALDDTASAYSDSSINTDRTLAWSGGSIDVRSHLPYQSRPDGRERKFIWVFIAADPTIS